MHPPTVLKDLAISEEAAILSLSKYKMTESLILLRPFAVYPVCSKRALVICLLHKLGQLVAE
jgi:hypothetical protein